MKETDRFLRDLLSKGLIYEKVVSKCTPTSGAVYLHKSLIGRKFRVILIPIDSDVDLNKGYIKVESERYNNMKDELARLKQTVKAIPKKEKPDRTDWDNPGIRRVTESEYPSKRIHIDTETKEEPDEEPLS